MKTLIKTLSISVLLAGASVALFSGCAATSTQSSTGEYIDDTAITAKVKTALFQDELIKGRDISVETFKGTVQLSGFVNTSREKELAGSIAAGVKGVTSVKNSLTIK